MPDNKEIRIKLKKLDRVTLNTLALNLGIKGYDKQEQQELVDNIVESNEEKAILEQLKHLDAFHLKSNEDIYLKLSALDPIVLNVVAHDLGMKDYSQQEKHELIENILKDRESEAILEELGNNWNEILLKLNGLNPIMLNVVAHDLAIKNYFQQDRHEIIGNIMKTWPREAILKELDNNWDNVFLTLNRLEENKLHAAAKKLGIRDHVKQEKHELIENILKSREKEKILKALKNKLDINVIGNLSSIIGLLVGIIGSVIYTEDIQRWWYSKESPGEQSVETTIPSIPDSSSSIPEHDKQESYDSSIVNQAERFFSSVRNAPAGTYDTNNFPFGFDKTPDIGHKGELKVNNDSMITGEMKFSHKKSANTFTLNSDGIISPQKGNEWTDFVTEMKFIWISGGCYDTECMDGFWMGKSEVTQGQWKKIMGNNPSFFIRGDDDPVENVSWDKIKEFIHKLNESDTDKGKTYRLPREAEWEHACKNGSGIDNISAGVQEWCEDVFHSHRQNRKPVQYSSHTVSRVVRGHPKKSSGCTYREGRLSSGKSRHTGFRLVSNQTQ